MHGGVGLCSCRHLVDEVCEGPVVPVTLVVNITEFEVARARGFGGLALERGEERVALRVCARSVLDVNGTAVGGLQLVRQEFIRAVPFDGDKVHGREP